MSYVRPQSLCRTIEAVDDALFTDRPIARAQREEVAEWIARRQGLGGSYAGMFAPTESDFAEGVRLFTGERSRSRAATAHILGEEACRVLERLAIRGRLIDDALARARAGLTACIGDVQTDRRGPGMFCCGSCSAALWRHLSTGWSDQGERWLAAGVLTLGTCRDGRGRWRAFPYYYTLLVLLEIGTEAARDELRYAAEPCRRLAARRPRGDSPLDQRRLTIARRVLAVADEPAPQRRPERAHAGAAQ